MTRRAPVFAGAFAGRWRITEMDEWEGDRPARRRAYCVQRKGRRRTGVDRHRSRSRRALRRARRCRLRRVLLGGLRRRQPRQRSRLGCFGHRRASRRPHLHPQRRQLQASSPNATDFFNSLLVSTHNVFRPDYEAGWFSAPFFDIEDAHHAKTDLWVIGNVALTLMHFFNEINEGRNVIKFVDNFWPLIQALGQKNKALRGEMMSTDRYKQAMAKEAARKQPATG